jgi:hypothetical protein
VRVVGESVTAGVVLVVTVMVEPALYNAPLESHTCVRITCDPVEAVTFAFTVFVFSALKTITSSR